MLGKAAAHKKALVLRQMHKRPRVPKHFTPTSTSWLNLVECLFSLLQRGTLWRAAFGRTDAFEAALRGYIAATHTASTPFMWTKTADGVLAAVKRFYWHTSLSGHPLVQRFRRE